MSLSATSEWYKNIWGEHPVSLSWATSTRGLQATQINPVWEIMDLSVYRAWGGGGMSSYICVKSCVLGLLAVTEEMHTELKCNHSQWTVTNQPKINTTLMSEAGTCWEVFCNHICELREPPAYCSVCLKLLSWSGSRAVCIGISAPLQGPSVREKSSWKWRTWNHTPLMRSPEVPFSPFRANSSSIWCERCS